jgi:hypothetical protein
LRQETGRPAIGPAIRTAASTSCKSSLAFINTQLLQAVLCDPQWAGKPTEEDRQGYPAFWSHVNPYGRFRLDMDTRLDLTAA